MKIDCSFVLGVATDPVIRAMVASINQGGHAMEIETIAEYVENAEILRHVQESGIDHAQGFAVGRPYPLN